MAKFFPFKRDNKCPSCGSSDGRCKTNQTIILCMEMDGVSSPPPGYSYRGRTKDEAWAIFAPGDDHADPVTRETWRLQQEAIKRKRAKDEARRLARSLPAEKRHKLNSRLLAELRVLNGLHPDDQADLHRRGITDAQIEEWGVVSVERGQRLSGKYPLNLAGIGKDGRSLEVAADGYLCPIRGIDGRLLGFQLRVRGEKYKWVSGNSRVQLPTGENPLAIFGNAGDTAYLVEGTGAKPFIASQRLQGRIIGAAGGQFAASRQQLQEACEGKTPILVPDGGAIANRNIMGQYRKVAELHPNLQVLWWNQLEKGADVDEVGPSVLESAQVLSWAEFEAIAKLENHKRKSVEIKQALCGLTREPDELRDERYLSAISLPDPGAITAVSSPCNTGKTNQLKGLVQQHRRQYPEGKRLMTGYRNGLLRQTGRKVNIRLIHDLESKGVTPNLRQIKDVALCVDSILRIELDHIPEHSLVILDEVDAIIKHLLSGGTLGDRHADIMQHFQDVLCTVLERNGFVVALEDGLGDLVLQFLGDTTGKRPYLILNQHQADLWEVELSTKAVSGFTNEILCSLAGGDRLCVATSSQEYAEKLDLLASKVIPGVRVLRVDSETAELPDIKRFQDAPDSFLHEHDTQLLIYTPTVESGVSIEDNHFDAVYGYFVHLEDRAQFQLLNRYRKPVPRFVLCSEFASTDDGFRGNPDTIIRDWQMSARRTAAIAHVEASLESDLTTDPTFDKTLLRIQAFQQWESNENAKFWNPWIARYQARAAGSQARMCDRLADLLEARGHHVTITDGWQVCKGTSAELREAKRAIHRRKALELSSADCADMTVEDARAILNRNDATKDERLAARKRLLQERLPGDDLDAQFLQDVIIGDRSKFLRATTLLWLTDHPDIAAHLDRGAFKSQLDKPFVIHKRLKHNRTKVATIVVTGIKELTDGREYRDDDELLQQIKANALKAKHDIRRYLDLNISEDQTATHIANKLLKRIGFKAQCVRQEGARGDRHRVWSVKPTEEMNAEPDFIDWDSYRDRIFKALSIKYAEFLKPPQEEDSSLVHTIPNTTEVCNKIVCTNPEPLPGSVLSEVAEAREFLKISPEAREIILSALSPQARKVLAA